MKLHIPVALAFVFAGFGCATPPPAAAPLSSEKAAASFDARSLQDPGLRRFLTENLGREPAATWDFETLSWVAFYFHPSLEVARAQWATSRAVQQTAAARPNPTVSLVPGYNSTREPGLSPWFPAINFDFLLQTSGKRAHQQDIARADAEVARLAVLSAAWQVRGELRRALIDFTNATARARGLREQVALQERLTALLSQRLAAGNATAAEVSAARSAQLKSAAALADANGQAAAAHARLAGTLSMPVAALAGQQFSPPPVIALTADALTAARRESLQSRTDVLGALAHYESTQAALALEGAKQQPDFHLGPGYQWDQGANKWSVGLTFELPIFHRNEGPVAEAVSRRAEAAAQFNAVQAQVVAAVDLAVAAQAVAAEQRDHAVRLRDEVAKQVARAQQRFDLGAADQLDRQTAALDLAGAELAIRDAEAAVTLAAGQLEDALEIPFPHLTALTPAEAGRANLSRTP